MRLLQSRTLWAAAGLAVLVSALGFLLGRGALAQPGQPGAQVGQEVVDLLQTQTEVPVVIALRSPPTLEALPSRPGPVDLAALQREIATFGDSVLTALGPTDFALSRRFEAVPALMGTVTQSGLQKLLAHPNVRRIDLPEGGAGHLTQSVPLINADDMHADGYTGAGVVVAILDSGLDASVAQADLNDGDLLQPEECFNVGEFPPVFDGIGGCPDGSERQSGVGAAVDGNGHGTNVAGIVTSAGINSSIGVAPDADIAAYRVLDAGGFFYSFTYDIVGPLNDIILNRPEVDVINMSLGTGLRFPGYCDNSRAWTMAGAAAINTLRARGVISFASSGNNASGVDMGAPACLSGVVSVGATYDANQALYTFPGVCTDPAPVVDQVACFTNSNNTTDIMAPGCRITSSGMGGGTSTYCGTSQASPHAAGCAALFLEANPALSPGLIESRLETSAVWVTDDTNSLSFPRIDCYPPVWATPLYVYSAKFVCGTAALADPLVVGDYETAINVHNPSNTDTATLYKKAALALPEEDPTGPVAPLDPEQLTLDPDYAFEIDCADIEHLLGAPDYTFYKGFVVVESYQELDVVAVYTTTMVEANAANGVGLDMDVEYVPVQVIETGSLKIEKRDQDNVLVGGATFDISPDPATGLDGPITVTDGGAGDPDATADGIILLTAVPTTYTVTETAAPAGCTVTGTNPQVAAASAGATTLFPFTDDCGTPTATATATATPTATATATATPTPTEVVPPEEQDPTFSLARLGFQVPIPIDPADLVVRSPGGAPPPTVAYACPAFGLGFCGGGDDVNALSLGKDFALPPPDPANPSAYLYFSVDPLSTGVGGTGVNNETVGCLPEPEADEFGSAAAGSNYQYFDGDGVPACANPPVPALGLVEGVPAVPGDDLDAVDPLNLTASGPPIFVTLDAASPSLFPIFTAADILVDFGAGIAGWYAPAVALGLTPGDDIDALCIDDADADNTFSPPDTVWFSLTAASASLGANSPADVFAAPYTGIPVVTAGQLGLLPGDELNALKCYQAPVPVCPEAIGNGKGIPGDDGTDPAMALDCDNDGLSDADELTGAACGGIVTKPGPDITYDDDNDGDPAAGSLAGSDPTDDPASWDTDGDAARDGAECTLGTDPTDSTDWPSTAACGGTVDTDGDGLLDAWETCKWGTNPNIGFPTYDTDGDTLGDCVEAADVDGNSVVDFVGDVIYYAKAALLSPATFGRDGDFDIDGNNAIDFVGDVIQEAKFGLIAGLCK